MRERGRGAVTIIAGLLLGACTPSPPPAAHVSASASPAPGDCAQRALARLDEPRRVGQLLWIGLRDNQLGADELAAIREAHAGSVWFTELSAAPLADVRKVSDGVQAEASPGATGSVAFLVAANQEGGQIDQFHGPGFAPIPPATEQGREDPPQLQAEATTWGRELRAAGVNLEVAPVLDTVPPGRDATNQPIGVLQRGFGHDPDTVTAHGLAFMAGMHAAGVPVTAKHFPGLGRVAGNTDYAAEVVDSATTADDPYLQPFTAAIKAGVDVVMVSTATYTRIDADRLAALSPVVIHDLLRGRLGFDGVVAADDLGAAAAVASISPADRALDFVAAGGDLVDIKYANLAQPMAAALLARAAADAGFRTRVDDAALRVLRLKARYGLLGTGCAAG